MLRKKSNDNVSIISIREEYIDGYHSCLDSVARERRFIGFLQAPPLESTREFVLSNIKNRVPQMLALKDGAVVGWCDISPMKGEGFTHCGRLGMGVLKGHRRQGIGSMLYEGAICEAKKMGLIRVELEVYASNRPAILFYEKWGFVHEGVKRRARWLDGVYDDKVVMALFI